MKKINFNSLIGKIFTKITIESPDSGNGKIIFFCNNNTKFELFHEQDCCEIVIIEDICGNLDDLIGTPILKAEESSSKATYNKKFKKDGNHDIFIWTFYKLATIKGWVDIRFYSASNGCYATNATLYTEIDKKDFFEEYRDYIKKDEYKNFSNKYFISYVQSNKYLKCWDALKYFISNKKKNKNIKFQEMFKKMEEIENYFRWL